MYFIRTVLNMIAFFFWCIREPDAKEKNVNKLSPGRPGAGGTAGFVQPKDPVVQPENLVVQSKGLVVQPKDLVVQSEDRVVEEGPGGPSIW